MACNDCLRKAGLLSGVAQKATGAVRLASAELGFGVAVDENKIAERRAICEACEQWDHGKCLKCGCYTHAKTKLTNERCPIGRW